MLKTERTEKTKFDEELTVLMIDGTEKQHDAKNEYYGKSQLRKRKTCKYMDSSGENIQTSSLGQLLDAQANDRACT